MEISNKRYVFHRHWLQLLQDCSNAFSWFVLFFLIGLAAFEMGINFLLIYFIWAIGFAIATAWLIYCYVDWSIERLIIDSRRVIYIEGVPFVSEFRDEIQIDDIQNVEYRQGAEPGDSMLEGLVKNFLKSGSVTIYAAGGMIQMQNIYNPERITKLLRNRSNAPSIGA